MSAKAPSTIRLAASGPVLGMILLAVLPARTAADELSRTDKLRVLYSNQFSFDRRGIPIITVCIAEGQNEVVIKSAAPLRVLPDGEEGAEVLGGRRWQVSLKQGRPAVAEHFAVLQRYPASALDRVRADLARWRQRGLRPGMMEIGSVFGVKGHVFDSRAVVLTDGPFSTIEKARRAATTHQGQRNTTGPATTVARLRRRPSGLLQARPLDGETSVRVRDAIWFAPAPGERLTVVASGSKKRSDPGRAYWGQIYVTVDRNGSLAVVNAVPADRLLAGLVPAEIFPRAPAAALRAQAVAARGELLAKIGTRHLEDPYLLCASQHCQVYAGAGHEHPRTTEAVNATRGLVLVNRQGQLVDTVYSASCGGHTEHNDHAWPVEADANLRGRLDGPGVGAALAPFARGIDERNIERWIRTRPPTFCGQSSYNRDRYRWTESIPASRLDELVAPLKVGSFRELHVLERGVSGRATRVEVVGTGGSGRVSGELSIRRLLGGLRSSMFLVWPRLDKGGVLQELVLQGGGWGHGVGLCQTGAIGMAQAGKGYQEILRHYYQGSELRPLY